MRSDIKNVLSQSLSLLTVWTGITSLRFCLRLALLFAVLGGTYHVSACVSTGFNIHASETVNGISGIPASYVGIAAIWNYDLANAQGSVKTFGGAADSSGHISNSSTRVPANWHIQETNGPCGGQFVNANVPNAGAVVGIVCVQTDPDFTASPNRWYNNTSPDVTITGSGISNSAVTYIMNGSGILEQTCSGATGGTTVTCYGVTLPVGIFHAFVCNPQSDGTYKPVGNAALTVMQCAGGPVCQ